jgi:hypothetical protein
MSDQKKNPERVIRTPRSWREAALIVGRRLGTHAECEQHPRDQADPGNCPYCMDRAVYDAFVRWAGERPLTDLERRLDDATPVPLEDLLRPPGSTRRGRRRS